LFIKIILDSTGKQAIVVYKHKRQNKVELNLFHEINRCHNSSVCKINN